jgi:hypothetical protein
MIDLVFRLCELHAYLVLREPAFPPGEGSLRGYRGL